MIEEKIARLLDEKFTEEAFEDCFLVEMKLHANNKLEIFVDSDSSITFEKCRKISRFLEKDIDEEGWLGEKYILEVSSPGITRPLKFPRQYQKNISRKIELKMDDGTKRTGILLAANDTRVRLEEKFKVKEGKKNKTNVVESDILYGNIQKAVIKVTF